MSSRSTFVAALMGGFILALPVYAASVSFTGVINTDGFFPSDAEALGQPISGVFTYDETLAPDALAADQADYTDASASFTVQFGSITTVQSVGTLSYTVRNFTDAAPVGEETLFTVQGDITSPEYPTGVMVNFTFFFQGLNATGAGLPLPPAFGTDDLYLVNGRVGRGGITAGGGLTTFSIIEVTPGDGPIIPTPTAAGLGAATLAWILVRRRRCLHVIH